MPLLFPEFVLMTHILQVGTVMFVLFEPLTCHFSTEVIHVFGRMAVSLLIVTGRPLALEMFLRIALYCILQTHGS